MAERETKGATEQNLRKDVDAIKADIDALRKDLTSVVGTLKGSASDRAEAEIDELRKRLERIAGNVQATGRERLRTVEAQIEERPMASLAMAFAVGLMLGRLFDRR